MRLPQWAHLFLFASFPALAGAQALHSFGNPSAYEQEYIEQINRARANPAAEGARVATSTHEGIVAAVAWAGVSLARFQTEMNAIAARPPLAPHSALTAAARSHSQWMFDHAQQVHDQPGGQTFAQRLSAAGYTHSSAGENIYAYADDAEYGHAGFEIDWSYPGDPNATFGMQNPRGHRNNIHSGSYREIGIGVVNGINTVAGQTVGPQIVTQDFGNRSAAPYYGTGVAYYDLDGDDSYDAGEGISGLTVDVSGASFYCLSADGGGWTVPIPSTATTRVVTFSGLGINESINLSVPASSNAKADLKLSYTAPVFTSPAYAASGENHTFQFTAVPGATGYHYSSTPLSLPADENCENLTSATASTSAGYSVVQSTVKDEGTNAWRMTFMNIGGYAYDQFIELSPTLLGTAASSMAFRSRLGQATTASFARVQVKEEGTSAWLDVYSQQGTGSSGEATFQARTASLATMDGKRFKIRFMFDATGSVSVGTTTGLGWYVDAITFASVYEPGTKATGTFATNAPDLPAPAASHWLLQINPVVGGHSFPGTTQTLRVLDTKSFADWAAYHEAHGGLPPGSLTPVSNPDGDGLPSSLEFAFGSNPLVPNAAPSGYPAVQASPTHFVVRYQFNTALTGVIVTPEVCTGSGCWFSPGQPGAPDGFEDVLVSSAGTVQTREARIPLDSGPRHFIRLRTTVP